MVFKSIGRLWFEYVLAEFLVENTFGIYVFYIHFQRIWRFTQYSLFYCIHVWKLNISVVRWLSTLYTNTGRQKLKKEKNIWKDRFQWKFILNKPSDFQRKLEHSNTVQHYYTMLRTFPSITWWYFANYNLYVSTVQRRFNETLKWIHDWKFMDKKTHMIYTETSTYLHKIGFSKKNLQKITQNIHNFDMRDEIGYSNEHLSL